jgi:hypothetical protein
MTSRVATGRWLIVAVIVSVLALSVLTAAAFNVAVGTDRQPQQVVRFVLTAWLCIFLYRRAIWARWVAGILFLLAGAVSLFAGFASELGDFLLVTMGTVYAAAGIILLFVPAVRVYFRGPSQQATAA